VSLPVWRGDLAIRYEHTLYHECMIARVLFYRSGLYTMISCKDVPITSFVHVLFRSRYMPRP